MVQFPQTIYLLSLSARRAWIEIASAATPHTTVEQSLSARRAWIEIVLYGFDWQKNEASRSARRAWIEISNPKEEKDYLKRRSPQGERGLKLRSDWRSASGGWVALRKESVD